MSLPLTDRAVVDALGADLKAANFTTDGVAELLGADAGAAFSRGLWWSALRATDRAPASRQQLATLVRLFLLGADETRSRAASAFPGAGVDALTAAGVLEPTPGGFRAVLDIRPHSDGARDFLVVSDQDAALRPGPVRRDHVLGIGGASVSLAHAVVRTPVGRALDVGTGCGIQALHLAGHSDHVVATDTNERALALAAATARLNGMSWDLRAGSLFEPVAGERFDLIVSNPPFVVGVGALDYIYRDSGMAGDALCENMIREVGDHLEPGGTAQIMANWIVRDGRDWRERVRGWLDGSGLHAWVVQREFADPISYVSLWTSDAGELPEEAARRGGLWLDWFDAEGIAGVGMGMIVVRAPRRGEHRRPEQVLEEITGADEQLTGPEVEAFFARREYLHDTSDDRLLATRLTTAPVFLDEQSLPGPEGWQTVGAAVRRPGGPGAVIGVDEVSRALLAGCRGEVPLGMLIELLAAHHDVDADALAAAALPVVREAIGRGILYEAR
ncbi:methyltransferase [Mycolicibacterium chubuense]|uniref:Release factor glutamine methyltransferase n=1 Tax=Mycolicibacterium chubuense TaxID=1800 RepID=A0A0J6WPN4_MYCCU|nr:methyltransferase [Mycolicibacterium chubuense]KMO84509.1 Release factor glutamine methyltransferase [Mycolicibacterium chubuense]ORA46551.1 methyltransferase [Mycolicibacterium chubuense]SPY00484.1 methyltransferase small [Mycolicibacterium chubuense]